MATYRTRIIAIGCKTLVKLSKTSFVKILFLSTGNLCFCPSHQVASLGKETKADMCNCLSPSHHQDKKSKNQNFGKWADLHLMSNAPKCIQYFDGKTGPLNHKASII